MTLAVCTKCGAQKFGALIACPDCKFAPKEPEDIARSMILTDHQHTRAKLDHFSQQLKCGKQITFDPTDVATYVETIKADPRALERIQHPERFPPSILDRIGCIVFPWTVFILIMAMAVFAIYRFITS